MKNIRRMIVDPEVSIRLTSTTEIAISVEWPIAFPLYTQWVITRYEKR